MMEEGLTVEVVDRSPGERVRVVSREHDARDGDVGRAHAAQRVGGSDRAARERRATGVLLVCLWSVEQLPLMPLLVFVDMARRDEENVRIAVVHRRAENLSAEKLSAGRTTRRAGARRAW